MPTDSNLLSDNIFHNVRANYSFIIASACPYSAYTVFLIALGQFLYYHWFDNGISEHNCILAITCEAILSPSLIKVISSA